MKAGSIGHGLLADASGVLCIEDGKELGQGSQGRLVERRQRSGVLDEVVPELLAEQFALGSEDQCLDAPVARVRAPFERSWAVHVPVRGRRSRRGWSVRLRVRSVAYPSRVPSHEIQPFAAELSAKLAARSRHVCLFLGAGASRACGLPDVGQLRDRVLERLDPEDRAAFATQLENRDLEQALSRLRRIAILLAGADQTVDGLTAEGAARLDRSVCRGIVEALNTDVADHRPALRLAAWAARADYHLPVELFTVNYDLLIETALEALGVPYFDGFSGALRARFRTEIVEAPSGSPDALPAFMVRLWKLHGSVHWAWEHDEVVRLGAPVDAGDAAAIYPSDTKYEESRRVPFVVLQDRFRRALQHPETLVLISGYSFGDAHLNEMIFDAARRRPRSEFSVFCYDDVPSIVAEQALSTPNLQVAGATEAIIGGIRAEWKAPDDLPGDLWAGDRFGLGDFENLSSFLARSSPPQGELQARLAELLAVAAEQADA